MSRPLPVCTKSSSRDLVELERGKRGVIVRFRLLCPAAGKALRSGERVYWTRETVSLDAWVLWRPPLLQTPSETFASLAATYQTRDQGASPFRHTFQLQPKGAVLASPSQKTGNYSKQDCLNRFDTFGHAVILALALRDQILGLIKRLNCFFSGLPNALSCHLQTKTARNQASSRF